MKPAIYDLGGKSANVVFSDADMAEVRSLRMGDPMDDATELGPVATETSRNRLPETIAGARAPGDGRLALGGGVPADCPEGFYVEPTVFADVDPASSLAQHECFGPVLSVMTFRTLEKAVEIANGTAFGLGACLHGRDLNRTLKMVSQINAGAVQVNGAPFARENAPFGGLGLSGYGREGGRDGLQEFIRIKNVVMNII